jgi:hypothetical protein
MFRVCQHTNLFEIENLTTFLVALASQHLLRDLKYKQCNIFYCNISEVHQIHRCLPFTTMKISNPAIPLGSTVVVIGANGYIALETCVKLLEAGFRVRDTVRDVQQHRTWMHKLFDTTWPSMFELVQVPAFEADKAFDVAFQGPYPSNIYLTCARLLTLVRRLQVLRESSMSHHLCFSTRILPKSLLQPSTAPSMPLRPLRELA